MPVEGGNQYGLERILSEFPGEIQLAELVMALNPDALQPEPVLSPLGFRYRKGGLQPNSFGITGSVLEMHNTDLKSAF